MSYVSCRYCDWQQDDFWSDDYNPSISVSRNLKCLTDALKKPPQERYIEVETWVAKDAGLPSQPASEGLCRVSVKDITLNLVTQIADEIRAMKWWTEEDFKKDPDPRCPVCKSSDLSID